MMGWDGICGRYTNWHPRTSQKVRIMNWRGLLCCLPLLWEVVSAQSYIRGQVLDATNTPLLGVEIYQPSTQQFFHTGSTGSFGFPSAYSTDSIVFTMEGYETLHIRLPGSHLSVRSS